MSLAAWCVLALIAGVLLGRWFAADRREIGADDAFDTLPDWAREETPIHRELLAEYQALTERNDWAEWALEMLSREDS